MIKEAIVLAGGLGTRLKFALPDLPKCLAPVSGKPFLSYLLDYAKKQGVEKFVFALGYKTELVEQFVKQNLPKGSYFFSVEEEPLGTGGAIYKAAGEIQSPDVIVFNADTFFGISLLNFSIVHELRRADCTLALKPMKSFDRYGAVELENHVITGFSEKKFQASGLINGGVYALSIEPFLRKTFPKIFSFEKEYLEKEYKSGKLFGMVSEAYFIDIGIPEDYERAQRELVESVD